MNTEILNATVVLLLGAAVGAALAWLLLKTKAGAVTAAEQATLKERLAGKENELQKQHDALQREVADHKQSRAENAKLQAELQGERRAAQERISSFNKATEELAERFKALSRDALKDNNQSFLQLAHATLEKFQENAKGDLEFRQKAIDQLVRLQYCDFVEQETVVTEDGRIRPDLIVRLPGNRTIVVDAKVPFDAFYESISTTDDEIRSARLKDHARLVRMHIGALSKKSYWESVQPTPEFVLLFLPGETFYSAALEHDPKLIEDGVGQGVIIATPTTLIALLKAVSYGWRQEQMAENAQEVSELGKTLYDRLRVFTNHFADIGKGIERALDSYNRGVGSFEGRVLRTARKFKERGALSGEDIEILEPIDKATRPLSLDEGGLFPDLVAAETEEMDEESLPLLNAKGVGQGGET